MSLERRPESMKELFERMQMAADASELATLVTRDNIPYAKEQQMFIQMVNERSYDLTTFQSVYRRIKEGRKPRQR